ncbi:A/G-specific adenine glycosylase [hydrothermal vent metagenome]|uniref:Adenine DNA glycosylase n=1 Tax=hydrothermal vent metagenome TaxID=652676 RepID=A0A3B0UHC9_9ZZZZ
MKDTKQIQDILLKWWDHNQVDLPWRRSKEPYAVWVSEIMLQQTQIVTVIPYFERWMARFPTVQTLAEASLDEVLKSWEGLGYYSRARNLHTAAQAVMKEWNGRLPQTVVELMMLKGIGRYTAGAIASIVFNEPVPVLDGNVIRVLSRLTDLPNDVTQTATKNSLWQLADELVPTHRPGDFNQAVMELGQQLCQPAKPHCSLCPLAAHCLARQRGTQLERPVRPPRKRIPHYDVVAGIIWQQGAAVGDPNGKFLIAQRPLNGLLGGLWEFPGGKQEPNETLPQALIREIQEELAIEISVGNFVTSIKHAYTHFRITLHAFHAHHRSGKPQHIDVANHAWVTLSDLDQYAFAVTDRKIIAALMAEA